MRKVVCCNKKTRKVEFSWNTIRLALIRQVRSSSSSGQVRLRTLVAHESRYVGVTLRMVNWPGKEKEMRIRVPT